MKRRAENLLRWLNVLIILATFVAYLSPFISPETFWLFSLFGTAYPWLLLFNILMVVFWIVLKKKYFFFSLACIIMGWSHLNGFIGLHFGTQWAKGETINVMTFNTQKFPSLRAGYRIIDIPKSKKVFQFMETEGAPDILCVQEIDDYHVEPMMNYFGFKDFNKINYYGTAIFSKFPILEKGRIEFDQKVNSCLWADVKAKGQTIRVYSLHLQSSSMSSETEKMMEDGHFNEKETWTDIRTILSKFKYSSKIRAQQAKIIAKHIEASPHPVIVCGDFNETPQSYAYRLISKNVNDTFRERGKGLGSTYAGNIPALRIDYILSDKRFQIIDNHILKKSYSDHYPVISTISINSSGN